MPAAIRTAERVKALGFETIAAPLIGIKAADDAPKPPPEDAVLIFTSMHGVRAFSQAVTSRHWPVVTVGDATAEFARSEGFSNVISASGSSDDIPGIIIDRFKPRHLVHGRGEVARGDFLGPLVKAGFASESRILYRQEAVTSLPIDDVQTISHVLFHSPMAARIFADFNPKCGRMTAISISAATDQALGNLEFAARRTALTPDERAMLAALSA